MAAAASLVAQASTPEVVVFSSPAAPDQLRTLKHPQPSGAPLVFLVLDRGQGMLKVLLPVRPNGTTGWIRETQVSISSHDFRIVVELDDHCITAFKGGRVMLREPVGVGRANTPTPGGLYYLKELYRPPNPRTEYGPFAYSLSGFS
ncbi:MAG: L,D-transpeptidase [Actinomycetota bacterium]